MCRATCPMLSEGIARSADIPPKWTSLELGDDASQSLRNGLRMVKDIMEDVELLDRTSPGRTSESVG